jgi:hypothetical protein
VNFFYLLQHLFGCYLANNTHLFVIIANGAAEHSFNIFIGDIDK